jgi:hypothetical protein
LASVARRLRAPRARESDLVYEAVNVNLGEDEELRRPGGGYDDPPSRDRLAHPQP